MRYPRSTMHSNMPFPTGRGPEYLVKDRGDLLDEIIDRLPNALSAGGREVEFALPASIYDVPGACRALRVIHRKGKGHAVFTDMTAVRTGPDVFLAFSTQISSWIAFLRVAMYVLLYFCLFAISNTLIFEVFDIAHIWLVKFRNTYQQGQVGGVGDQQGLDSRGLVVSIDTREDRMEMIRQDPYLFFSVVAPPIAFVGVATGVVCWLLPAGLLSWICRRLDWPTPEEMTTEAAAHRSHVNTAAMSFLLHEYGIDGSVTRKA